MFRQFKNLFNIRNSSNSYDEEENQGKKTQETIGVLFKSLPLKAKLIIIGVICGSFLLFLLLTVVLIEMDFIDLDDATGTGNSYSYSSIKSESTTFWWPIGSIDTETIDGVVFANGDPSITYISSEMGDRVIDNNANTHKGIDISGGGQVGYHNVIASSAGIVYYVNSNCDDNGYYGNSCGGGYGNYVVIQHSNNIYTIYGHMAKNSITVSIGDVVKQGQVIGKIGNSGSSTGAHLHFQIDVGGFSDIYAINPLTYISIEDPRPVAISNDKLLLMLRNWEGTGEIDGDNYVAYLDPGGYLTVGQGILVSAHEDRFRKRGIDPSTIKEGSRVPISVADDIKIEIVNEFRDAVVTSLNANNIAFEDYQIDALTSFRYNVGNNNCFFDNYSNYGLTKQMYDQCFAKYVTSNGIHLSGLVKRRKAEWTLLTTGVYPF